MNNYFCVKDNLDIIKIPIENLADARFFTRSIFQIEEGTFDFEKTVFISEEDALCYVIGFIKSKITHLQSLLTEQEQKYVCCKKEAI